MKNPFEEKIKEAQYMKTWEITLSPDATFDDIVNVINALHIRYTGKEDDPEFQSIRKHSKEVTI